MPISATGNRRGREDGSTPLGRTAEHGFTLIELMVVLVIVALATAAVVVALPSGSRGLRGEATAFAARAVAARNAAIVSGRPVRVVADAGGYRVEERRAGKWQPWAGKAGRQVAWESGTSAALDGAVAFDSTGLSDPATLQLARGGRAMAVRVEADGGIRVEG
jgi:general secretion pathway protein H